MRHVVAARPSSARSVGSRLLRAWIVIALIDGTFASTLAVVSGGAVAALFRRLAATVFGREVASGPYGVGVGVAVHATVAFVWTAIFLILTLQLPWLRRLITSWPGTLIVAAIYGPLIWMVMSLGVIPVATGSGPVINTNWWIQLVAHVPFVAVPIVAMIGGRPEREWR